MFSEQHPSSLLYREQTASNFVSTQVTGVYGNQDGSRAITFRIGNGGAGYTGVLKVLAEAFIKSHEKRLRIGWVANPSRFTLVALLPDVVQVALTYEPNDEQIACEEGWATRVCKVFNDHFVLVGPSSNPANIKPGEPVVSAFRKLGRYGGSNSKYWASSPALFQSRGNASATYAKEKHLFRAAKIDASRAPWLDTEDLPPYEALKLASMNRSYHLTDRATLLTAVHEGTIKDMVVYAEGGRELLNPCSAMVAAKRPQLQSGDKDWPMMFAKWLAGDEAQGIIKHYGTDWSHGMPLFTTASEEHFEPAAHLAGKHLAGNARPLKL